MAIWKIRSIAVVFVLSGLLALARAPAGSGERVFITLASTTSTQNSGLLAHILPLFEAESGIVVRVIAVGTGQAIRIAKRGDADVLLVHHRSSEEVFVKDGFGVRRHDVMYNDFVIVGPKSDPARIVGSGDGAAALAQIAKARAVFVSRGDNSGTHKKENELWSAARVDPVPSSGTWYLETGLGMGAALNVASEKNAYVLSDRGTWISFSNKSDLVVLVEGDKNLFNPYGVILVDPQRHPHVKAKEGQIFIDWITSRRGQAAIAGFRRDGQQLFYPSGESVAPRADTDAGAAPAQP